MENEGLLNLEGKQYCKACESTFTVYSDNENGINFCPFCSASSDKFDYDEN